LEGGPPSFTPDFTRRALLRNSTGCTPFPYRAVTVCGAPFQATSSHSCSPSVGPTTPIPQGDRFRLCPFRSPLLRASRLISLPPGTEMFQFPGFASLLPVMTDVTARRVAPFGHLGITACVPLPRAYRSLPRPSSPLCAQASPTCFRSLDPFFVKQSTRDLLTRVKQFFTCYANCVTSEIQIRCTSLAADTCICPTITQPSVVNQHA
jgi:hypothetical protein